MSEAPDLAARLAELPLGEELGPTGRAALAQRAVARRIEAGGDAAAPQEGGCLVLLTGRLELLRRDDDRCIAQLERGEVGAGLASWESELALRAATPVELVEIPASGLDRLLERDPEALARFTERVGAAERSIQLALHLAGLFEGLEREGIEEFRAGVDWLALRGGEVLFHEGDPGDAAYLVISGRLRAVSGSGDDERALNEVGARETVGEMALLADAPRSATVYALRDTQLARLSREVFDSLTERYPKALRRIAGFVVERLRRRSADAPRPASLVSLAVVPAQPGIELGGLVTRLAGALAELGSVTRVNRRTVEAALGRPGIADAPDREASGMRLVRWLNRLDADARYLVYEADPDWTPWTERALRQADHVLVVARAEDGPELGENEARLAEIWRKARPPRRSLVLLHAPGTSPRNTSAWLARRDVERHFHVRGESDPDVARLARLITGNGVGLVFGGGGARGFAHLGVLRALEEAGAPIDSVGGTSIGAIVGALVAIGHDAGACLELCRRSFSRLFDPTLPVVSLLTGRRIGERMEAVIGGFDIEDLPLPFFCVATNLTRAGEVVHRRGPLFRAVRSSISLPGILPPIAIDGDLHVDGGLLNNLPIDVMAAETSGGPLVSVDVSPEVDLRSQLDLAPGVSGWGVLWKRWNPFVSTLDVPYISSVLMRSVVVGSLANERDRSDDDPRQLHLKLPVDEWSLLEFERLDPIAQRGYEASVEPVGRWWRERAGVGSGRGPA